MLMRQPPLWSYALARRCPVLTQAMLLPGGHVGVQGGCLRPCYALSGTEIARTALAPTALQSAVRY
eukprot:1341613-Rhodomonas_salina.1